VLHTTAFFSKNIFFARQAKLRLLAPQTSFSDKVPLFVKFDLKDWNVLVKNFLFVKFKMQTTKPEIF
jgi:hypothetical protein